MVSRTHPSLYSFCNKSKYVSHLFPITFPQVKHLTGIIILGLCLFFYNVLDGLADRLVAGRSWIYVMKWVYGIAIPELKNCGEGERESRSIFLSLAEQGR